MFFEGPGFAKIASPWAMLDPTPRKFTETSNGIYSDVIQSNA